MLLHPWSLLHLLMIIGWAQPSTRALHLDHVPIVVRDLEAAEQDFRRLGFRLKPGRAHSSSIRNSSIKFADGSYVELITVTQERDALNREYLDLLREGDGAAYAFLRDDQDGTMTNRWVLAGGRRVVNRFIFTAPPAAWREPHLQLIAYSETAPENPRLLRHPNSARRLRSLWLVSDRWTSGLRRGLEAKQVMPGRWPFLTASSERIDRVALADGTCLFLVQSARLARRGAMVLAVAIERSADQRNDSLGSDAIWVPPSRAHGIWLQLASGSANACATGVGNL